MHYILKSLSLSLSLSLSHIILRLRLFFMCPLLHHDQPYLIYSPIWDNFGCDHMASSWVSLQQTLELVERELIKRVCVCVERQACVSKNLVKFSQQKFLFLVEHSLVQAFITFSPIIYRFIRSRDWAYRGIFSKQLRQTIFTIGSKYEKILQIICLEFQYIYT